jgi:hypothetical protein
MKLRWLFILAICILIPAGLKAQDDQARIIDNQIWADYYQYYNFKPDWQFYGDFGARSVLDKWTWFTAVVRPGVRWKKHRLWELHGGIGLFFTMDKEDVNTFEIRPWQGVKVNWPEFKPIRFNHYFRLEERFNFPTDTWTLEFNLRFRYRFALRTKIYTFPDESRIFLPASFEVFANVGPQLTEKFSNRSRFSIGGGYKWNEQWTFELHFVAQFSRTGEEDEFNTSDRLFQLRVRRFLFKKDYRSKIDENDYSD